MTEKSHQQRPKRADGKEGNRFRSGATLRVTADPHSFYPRPAGQSWCTLVFVVFFSPCA